MRVGRKGSVMVRKRFELGSVKSQWVSDLTAKPTKRPKTSIIRVKSGEPPQAIRMYNNQTYINNEARTQKAIYKTLYED